MIRIAISVAAYQALAATMPEDTVRPPEPLKDRSRLGESGEGVGLGLIRTRSRP
jgi:hypothetical protein